MIRDTQAGLLTGRDYSSREEVAHEAVGDYRAPTQPARATTKLML